MLLSDDQSGFADFVSKCVLVHLLQKPAAQRIAKTRKAQPMICSVNLLSSLSDILKSVGSMEDNTAAGLPARSNRFVGLMKSRQDSLRCKRANRRFNYETDGEFSPRECCQVEVREFAVRMNFWATDGRRCTQMFSERHHAPFSVERIPICVHRCSSAAIDCPDNEEARHFQNAGLLEFEQGRAETHVRRNGNYFFAASTAA